MVEGERERQDAVFYMKTPSGFSMEYRWGGVLVDDAVWRVTHHSTTQLWGHEHVA